MTSMHLPPAPDGPVLSLVAALSNTQNHELHVQAIRARDEALSASPESYGNLCAQLGYLMAGTDQPAQMIQRISASHLAQWSQTDPSTAMRLQQDETLWTPFGQMAGLILKQALLRPPILTDGRSLYVVSPAADQVKEVLLYCLGCQHSELRDVASTVIATTAVSTDSVQPALSMKAWPQLMPTLLHNFQQANNPNVIEGSLSTVRKIMEDGPQELRQDELDALIPILIHFLSSPQESSKTSALQSIVACLLDDLMPSALVAHFPEYLAGLSNLSMDPSPKVRKWVCRSIVTLLSMRTEYLQPHIDAISQFMLKSTMDIGNPDVALEACEFWLTFASLDDEACTPDMIEQVAQILPQLIPTLLRGMVYLQDQQDELKHRNEMDLQENFTEQSNKPVFHKSKAKKGEEDSEDDNDDDFDDGEGNAWTLRKCSAASLDCLAALYGPEGILPPLLPALQDGLSSADPWIQEASILALGAVSEGCGDAMRQHMTQLHGYLMNHLATPESPLALPQVKIIAAWTIGRYSSWAVELVQSGARGHLLAQMTEVFLARLADRNTRVQIACCSAFGVLIESAGDLMVPYLEPVFQGLMAALTRYRGRSTLIIFDVLGILADFVGPAIGEGNLPAIYLPPILQIWDSLAKNDPMDKTLVPLLECIASIALTCGTNFQPYALETFENSMCMIETITLYLTAGDINDEDADPIICAADVIDGLVEGLGANFSTLLASSSRYSPFFHSMLVGLTQHEVPGVRMSAFAIMGDLANRVPAVLEPALPQLLKVAVVNLDPIQPAVCNNAVWAIGEICVKCQGNPVPLEAVAADLVQRLISLLMGNGVNGGGIALAGLPENAATTIGRLAKVNSNFVAQDLPRFLLGWCDGMAKIADPNERRDAFQGFIQSLYANPGAIQAATVNPADAISSILFAIVSWHMPEDVDSNHIFNVQFQPFPQAEAELGATLRKLIQDIKSSAGEDTWSKVHKQMPANVIQLLRDTYQV